METFKNVIHAMFYYCICGKMKSVKKKWGNCAQKKKGGGGRGEREVVKLIVQNASGRQALTLRG